MDKLIFDLKKYVTTKEEKDGKVRFVRELVPVSAGTGFLVGDKVFYSKHFTKSGAIKTLIECIALDECKPTNSAKTEYVAEFASEFRFNNTDICVNYRLWIKKIED